MKKILTHLKGTVFIIAILVASSCNNPDKAGGEILGELDSNKVTIRLKAIKLVDSIHLEMFDSNNPDCPVIDNLFTVVPSGDTVVWKKAPNSNIRSIDDIRPVGVHSLFSEFLISSDSVFALQIPSTAEADTIKYEIEFTLLKGGTHIIDPYLRIED